VIQTIIVINDKSLSCEIWCYNLIYYISAADWF